METQLRAGNPEQVSRWGVGQGEAGLIRRVCHFLWCKHSNLGPFQGTNMAQLGLPNSQAFYNRPSYHWVSLFDSHMPEIP